MRWVGGREFDARKQQRSTGKTAKTIMKVAPGARRYEGIQDRVTRTQPGLTALAFLN